MKKTRNKKILMQVGCLVFALLALSAVINGISIYRSSSKNYLKMLYQQTEDILFQAKDCLTQYESLPWLIGYWRDHSTQLDLPGDRQARAAAAQKLLLTYGAGSLQAVTPQQAELFTEEEQRVFAEQCYLDIMPRLFAVEHNFALTDVYCVRMISRETARPLFQSVAEGELTPMGNFCALGEEWPFNADMHPAVDELYALQENRSYFEQVTSTTTGVEYLFGYIPVMVDGEIACHICVSLTMSELRASIASNTRSIEWMNGLLLFASAAGLLLLIRRIVLRPLAQMQRSVREYQSDKNSESIIQKLSLVNSSNEVGRLADDVSAMVAELERYSIDMAQLSAEKERIDTELNLATQIQADMLPNIFPAFPDRKEFIVYASMDPAKEVGGDFYDFFLIDDRHLGLVIADVSGKGVPASLFMMISKLLLKICAEGNSNPAEVLEQVNDQLCANNPEEMFVTIWFGVLDTETGELTAANAGHDYPVLMRAGGRFELVMDEHGFLAGVVEGAQYRNYTLQLAPGSKLFVYTDGVPEATNAEKELFGTDRMLAALNANPGASPEGILKQMRQAVDGFVRDAPQFDDLTMLCLEYRGPGGEPVKSA